MGKLELWLILPLVAALIGWFTNFIAVRMIFRPRNPIRLPGFRLQGILPKRKAEFAKSIGETVSEHLLTTEDIKEFLHEPNVRAKLRASVAERIDGFLDRKLGSNPMLGAFLKGPFIDSLKVSLLDEVEAFMDDGVALIGDHLDEKLDLHRIVEEKILGFDMDRLEAITLKVASKELRAIEVLGAVLGFLVGILQLIALQLIA